MRKSEAGTVLGIPAATPRRLYLLGSRRAHQLASFVVSSHESSLPNRNRRTCVARQSIIRARPNIERMNYLTSFIIESN